MVRKMWNIYLLHHTNDTAKMACFGYIVSPGDVQVECDTVWKSIRTQGNCVRRRRRRSRREIAEYDNIAVV